MSSILIVSKSPADVLPVFVDWRLWLAGESEQLGVAVSIASCSWSADGVDLLASPPPSVTGTVASTWIGGGSAGRAVITCRITTDAGHDVSRSVDVLVTA